jgi:hypothetical protein
MIATWGFSSLKNGMIKKGLVGWSREKFNESLARNRRRGKHVKILNMYPVDLMKVFMEKETAVNKPGTGPGKKARGKEDWPFYINSKGERVYVVVSRHAIERFKVRSRRLNGVKVEHPEDVLVRQFNCAQRIIKLNNRQRKRASKYKGDTLFFRFMELVFVVCDATIVTVELAGKKTRLLN